MTTLREAAQQALEALEDYKYAEAREALRAALAEPVQEPVAWSHINGTSDTKWHPPQRKPLTEEEIKKLLIESAGMTVTFSAVDLSLARAIERVHGIK